MMIVPEPRQKMIHADSFAGLANCMYMGRWESQTITSLEILSLRHSSSPHRMCEVSFTMDSPDASANGEDVTAALHKDIALQHTLKKYRSSLPEKEMCMGCLLGECLLLLVCRPDPCHVDLCHPTEYLGSTFPCQARELCAGIHSNPRNG